MSYPQIFEAYLHYHGAVNPDARYRATFGPRHPRIAQNPRGPRDGYRQSQIALRYLEYFERNAAAIRFETVDDLEEWFDRVAHDPPARGSETWGSYRATIRFARYMDDLRSSVPGPTARRQKKTGVRASRSRAGNSQPIPPAIQRPLPTDNQGPRPSKKRSTNRHGQRSSSRKQKDPRQGALRSEHHRRQDDAAQAETDPESQPRRASDDGPHPAAETAPSQINPEQEAQEMRAELKNEARKHLALEMARELQQELRASVEQQLREELRTEVEAQLRQELRQQVEAELRDELRPQVEAALYDSDELRQEVAETLERKCVEEAEAEIAAEAEAEAEEEEEEESTVEAADDVASNGHEEDSRTAGEMRTPSVGVVEGDEGHAEDVTSERTEEEEGEAQSLESEMAETTGEEPGVTSPAHVEQEETQAQEEASSEEEAAVRPEGAAVEVVESEPETQAARDGPTEVSHVDSAEGGESSTVLVGGNQSPSMEASSEAPRVSPRSVSPPIKDRKRKREDDDEEAVKEGPPAKKLRMTEDAAVEMPPTSEEAPSAVEVAECMNTPTGVAAQTLAVASGQHSGPQEDPAAECMITPSGVTAQTSAVVHEQQSGPHGPSAPADEVQTSPQREAPAPESQQGLVHTLEEDDRRVPSSLSPPTQPAIGSIEIPESQQHLGVVNTPGAGTYVQPLEHPVSDVPTTGHEYPAGFGDRVVEGVSTGDLAITGAADDEPMVEDDDEEMGEAETEAVEAQADQTMVVAEVPSANAQADTEMDDAEEGSASSDPYSPPGNVSGPTAPAADHDSGSSLPDYESDERGPPEVDDSLNGMFLGANPAWGYSQVQEALHQVPGYEDQADDQPGLVEEPQASEEVVQEAESFLESLEPMLTQPESPQPDVDYRADDEGSSSDPDEAERSEGGANTSAKTSSTGRKSHRTGLAPSPEGDDARLRLDMELKQATEEVARLVEEERRLVEETDAIELRYLKKKVKILQHQVDDERLGMLMDSTSLSTTADVPDPAQDPALLDLASLSLTGGSEAPGQQASAAGGSGLGQPTPNPPVGDSPEPPVKDEDSGSDHSDLYN